MAQVHFRLKLVKLELFVAVFAFESALETFKLFGMLGLPDCFFVIVDQFLLIL